MIYIVCIALIRMLNGEELHFEWKSHIPSELGTFGPPNDLKGHSITYIGNKLVLLGGDERSKNDVKKNYQIKKARKRKRKWKMRQKTLKNNNGNKAAVVESKNELTAEACRQMRVYVLDVLKQRWYLPTNIGDYTPTNRSGHGAELWGGQIVLTGGYDNSDEGAIDRNSRLVKTNAERFVVV